MNIRRTYEARQMLLPELQRILKDIQPILKDFEGKKLALSNGGISKRFTSAANHVLKSDLKGFRAYFTVDSYYLKVKADINTRDPDGHSVSYFKEEVYLGRFPLNKDFNHDGLQLFDLDETIKDYQHELDISFEDIEIMRAEAENMLAQFHERMSGLPHYTKVKVI